MNEIKKMYSEHLETPFPDGLRGSNAADQDLAMLDTNIAGVVSAYLNNNGKLDTQRLQILKRLVSKMDDVINEIPQDAKGYFLRLKRLGELTLKN